MEKPTKKSSAWPLRRSSSCAVIRSPLRSSSSLLVAMALLLCIALNDQRVAAQCPWSRSVPALQGFCACSYNLAHELTLQCGQVSNFTVLVTALNDHAHNQVIDLLYVHNSSVVQLVDDVFRRLTVHNVQLSRCQIGSIAPRAFAGQEASLKNLNLQDNELTSVPVLALRSLASLALLDLSGNRISNVPDDAFSRLKLTTLKLADNGNLSLSQHSFRGLERTLKNLNLKGMRLREVPAQAISQLGTLAFLDLAQNAIRSLGGGLFRRLDSLAAINLERNMLATVEPDAFLGVNDTLSSLSLLNNLITEYPTKGLSPLNQLRVLDVGFNLIETLPNDAFASTSLLTLLALDGNPLSTLPKQAFTHLNGTLRGLSLGGRFLECDCRLGWVAEWIRDTDLQVTSRERNPQFCASPPDFRTRSFYQLAPEEFQCTDEKTQVVDGEVENKSEEGFKPMVSTASSSVKSQTTTTTTSTTTVAPSSSRRPTVPANKGQQQLEEEEQEIQVKLTVKDREPADQMDQDNSEIEEEESQEGQVVIKPVMGLPPAAPAAVPATASPQPPTLPTRRSQQSPLPPRLAATENSRATPPPATRPSYPRTTTQQSINNQNKIVRGGSVGSSSTVGTGTRTRSGSSSSARPNLILGNNNHHSEGLESEREVIVRDAYRQDTSVVIQWDSETTNILGFRVVYRLFGDNNFQPGPPLDPSEREFKIKNVPAQESLVVCVVSLEESNVTPETVPFPQCREIRTEGPSSSHMDKIIIAASAAICGTVVIAVIVFICCNRKRSSKSEKLRLGNVLAAAGAAGGPGAMQHGNISATAASQGQPPTLVGLGGNGNKDWDQMSMYSTRSIPRARMYHSNERSGSVMGSVNGGFIGDDSRSHVSGYSMNKASVNGSGVNLIRTRSLVDGQGRSISALSGGRGATYLPPGLHHGLGAMGHHSINQLAGLGLGGLNMLNPSALGGSMAGLPTGISGLGPLSRADFRASHHSLADLRMSELAAAAAAANGRASRASRSSTRASGVGGGGIGGGGQFSGRRSEQLRRRSAHMQQQGQDRDSSDRSQTEKTGDESSWETDREQAGSNSTSGLLMAGRRPQQIAQQHNNQRQSTRSNRMRPASSMRSDENWTDMDMEIYMAHNTMQRTNDLVRL